MGQDFYLILENLISFIGYLSTDYFEQDAVSEKLWFKAISMKHILKGQYLYDQQGMESEC